MSKEALQKAIDNLHIRDVYLRSLHSDCEEGFDPKYADLSALLFQTRHFVKKSEVVGIDGDCRLLRVFVDLGARWVEEKGADDVVVKAFIEAEFVAEYELKEELEQRCIDLFSLKNASYHVWPYWRELMASQSMRMHLPKVTMPTVQFARNSHLADAGEEG